MTRKEYSNIVVPNVDKDVDYYEKKYPERNLKEGAIVTRYAPSPTGFVHIGALLQSFISMKMSKQTEGVFFLRIEDTDQKRTIEGATKKLIDDLQKFNITFDEGITLNGQKGNYGPYIQSERKEIYRTYIKHLVELDLAYPCFCTEEDGQKMREHQELNKERIGYYGRWAKCRRLSNEEVVQKINSGEKYIIRIKSPGNFEKKFKFKDEIKGKMELPENDLDIIIMKQDGLPTYHFAHAIDDHLMHTTHVIRGDEWLSSIPIHTQLFRMLGFKVPKYAHIAPLMKNDNGVKRKISKRKDPEAAVSYYHEIGIPDEAIMLYLATVANSNFEMWMIQNKDKNINDFKFEFKKMSISGALFDYEKLENISKNFISTLKAEEVYNRSLIWAKEYDDVLASLLTKYKDYSIKLFNIERERKKPRKDIIHFGDVKNQLWYMYDELFDNCTKEYEFQTIKDKKEITNILNLYINEYYNIENQDIWFDNIKKMADKLGYASDMKEYKMNPKKYKGNIADISNVIRVALTTKYTTPDMYEIMTLLGEKRIKSRIKVFTNN